MVVLAVFAFRHAAQISVWPPFGALQLKGFLTVLIILGSGCSLTIIGTITYLVDVHFASWDRLPGFSRGLSGTALFLCIGAILLLCLYPFIYFVFLAKDLAKPEGMISLQHHNDGLLLCVFTLFGVVDLLLASNLSRACDALSAQEEATVKAHALALRHNRAFATFSYNQLSFIDIPVIGLIILNIVLGLYLENNPTLNIVKVEPLGDATEATISKALIVGISCGLLGAHIIFSQMIFAALKLREIASEAEPAIAGDTGGNERGEGPPPWNPQPPPQQVQVKPAGPATVPRNKQKRRPRRR